MKHKAAGNGVARKGTMAQGGKGGRKGTMACDSSGSGGRKGTMGAKSKSY